MLNNLNLIFLGVKVIICPVFLDVVEILFRSHGSGFLSQALHERMICNFTTGQVSVSGKTSPLTKCAFLRS